MKKYVFWNVLKDHTNIALTEDLSQYAQGDTFWQALRNLSETLKDWVESLSTEETDINSRMKLFRETGINKIEILVEAEKKKYSVNCANSRCVIKAPDERSAVIQYISTRAKTSVVNTGEVI
ncbi:hypothetical protein ACFLT9_06380 [Acidobacteriota bacterium]